MVNETMQTSYSGDKQKQMDREVRDMVSAITHRIAGLHKPNGSDEDDGDGVKVVTLAGTNTGATMRSELDEKSTAKVDGSHHEALNTYVNSNFQAVNNSIMMGSSYNTNDPGVHLDISDAFENHNQNKHGKKQGTRKDKSSFNGSEHHSN